MQWALVWLAAAHAGVLSEVIPAWSVVEEGGGDGDGAARAVLFESNGDITAAGWVTGAPGHDNDARVSTYTVTGLPVSTVDDDVGEVTGTLQSSDDRWYDAFRDDTERLVLCGQRGAVAPVDTEWWALTRTDDDEVVWELPYRAGDASPSQACRSLATDADKLYTAGYSIGSPTIDGQWHLWALNRNTALITQQSIIDFGRVKGVVDTAYSIDVYDDATTVVIGDASDPTAGVGVGLVQRRAGPTVEWAWQVPGARYEAVAVEIGSGRTAVVGELSGQGTILVFNQSSDEAAQPPLWELAWSEPEGSGISGVVVDELGDFVALGWVREAGVERWRLVRYDKDDGTELDRIELPAWAGDSRPHAAAFDGELTAIAGTIDEGAGPRFGVLVLGPDRDGDLVADVVDECPDDVGKSEPGVCGCEVADNDTDGDGVLGCEEDCPSDPFKLEPGVCGCNVPDEDDDGDGTLDCEDECEDDPDKVVEGVCGCGVADTDDDGDGYLVCQDQCPDSAPGAVVDAVGCEIVEAVDTAIEDTGSAPVKLDEGCGCRSAGISPWWGMLLAAGLLRRRSGAARGC